MLLLILLSMVFGALVTLFIQFWFLQRWFYSIPPQGIPVKPQTAKATLPKELRDMMDDLEKKSNKKESCVAVNLLLHFLFNECKDADFVRNWFMKKLNSEFAEMLNSTTGRLLDQITVRNMNFGEKFPVIEHCTINNTVMCPKGQILEEVSVDLQIDYSGGFQLAVDVDLVLGKSAYLSVHVTQVTGVARLHFHRQPYTHWSISFIEDPVMRFQVESQFEGRPIQQIASLVINQIRRAVRKKHTLPGYKIRYKPFFYSLVPKVRNADVFTNGVKLSCGKLNVTVSHCSRLQVLIPQSYIYCTLALDSQEWLNLSSSAHKLWVMYEFTICKIPDCSIGITFKEEFIPDKYEERVMIESISPDSSADNIDLRKNDVVLAIGSTKINNSKQAVRVIKQSSDSFTIQIERASRLNEFNINEARVEEEEQDDSVVYNLVPSAPRHSKSADADIGNIVNTQNTDTNVIEHEGLHHRNISSSALDSNQEKSSIDGKDSEMSDNISLSKVESMLDLTEDNYERVNSTGDRRKTVFVKSNSDPIFGEDFLFDVESEHNYLNVCVWCKVPEKLDKQNRVVKAERDLLIAHTSISLMDVSLECLATTQGNVHRTYHLNPVEQKSGIYKSKINALASHSGFAEKLCGGDITLGFNHCSKTGTSCGSKLTIDSQAVESQAQLETQVVSSPDSSVNKHQFMGTNFQSSTYCNFCHKKIWLKVAFRCDLCGMICHKKCTEKCQAQTTCSSDGFDFKPGYRQPSPPIPRKQSSKESVCEKETGSKESLPGKNSPKQTGARETRASSFLNKFRKDVAVAKLQNVQASLMPGNRSPRGRSVSPDPLRRRSMPSEDEQQKHSLQTGDLCRTRSSTSLQSMDASLNTKSISGEDLDSSSDEEATMLRYITEQKSQNADELVVTAAKQMGKELYAHMSPEQRQDKLDSMVNKLQGEIDEESDRRAEFAELAKQCTNSKKKEALRQRLEASDEKIQSLALLMLHYCAGLQHCLDTQEEEKQQEQEREQEREEKKLLEDQEKCEEQGIAEANLGELELSVKNESNPDVSDQVDGEENCEEPLEEAFEVLQDDDQCGSGEGDVTILEKSRDGEEVQGKIDSRTDDNGVTVGDVGVRKEDVDMQMETEFVAEILNHAVDQKQQGLEDESARNGTGDRVKENAEIENAEIENTKDASDINETKITHRPSESSDHDTTNESECVDTTTSGLTSGADSDVSSSMDYYIQHPFPMEEDAVCSEPCLPAVKVDIVIESPSESDSLVESSEVTSNKSIDLDLSEELLCEVDGKHDGGKPDAHKEWTSNAESC